jgi:hypothetical protein
LILIWEVDSEFLNYFNTLVHIFLFCNIKVNVITGIHSKGPYLKVRPIYDSYNETIGNIYSNSLVTGNVGNVLVTKDIPEMGN